MCNLIRTVADPRNGAASDPHFCSNNTQRSYSYQFSSSELSTSPSSSRLSLASIYSNNMTHSIPASSGSDTYSSTSTAQGQDLHRWPAGRRRPRSARRTPPAGASGCTVFTTVTVITSVPSLQGKRCRVYKKGFRGVTVTIKLCGQICTTLARTAPTAKHHTAHRHSTWRAR
jgi:hypothetical protein